MHGPLSWWKPQWQHQDWTCWSCVIRCVCCCCCRVVGMFGMVLQQLVETRQLTVSDCLLDDNNVPLKANHLNHLLYESIARLNILLLCSCYDNVFTGHLMSWKVIFEWFLKSRRAFKAKRLTLCDNRRTPASSWSSFVTKWGSRIFQEPFQLESPNFTGTSLPTCPSFSLDMWSLTTSGRKLPDGFRLNFSIKL